jgi:hypothetical protein
MAEVKAGQAKVCQPGTAEANAPPGKAALFHADGRKKAYKGER